MSFQGQAWWGKTQHISFREFQRSGLKTNQLLVCTRVCKFKLQFVFREIPKHAFQIPVIILECLKTANSTKVRWAATAHPAWCCTQSGTSVGADRPPRHDIQLGELVTKHTVRHELFGHDETHDCAPIPSRVLMCAVWKRCSKRTLMVFWHHKRSRRPSWKWCPKKSVTTPPNTL